MSSSQPTWADLERVTALLRDVGDAPPDGGQREAVFLEGVTKLFRARVGLVFRGELVRTAPAELRMVSVHQLGFGEREQSLLDTYVAENGQDDPCIAPSLGSLAECADNDGQVWLRQELIPDAEFARHPHFTNLCTEVDVDSRLIVTTRLSGGRLVNLSLHRGVGDRPFNERDKQLLRSLGLNALRLLGWPALPVGGVLRGPEGELLDLRDAQVDGGFDAVADLLSLTSREREVALWVRRGRSNKEIARELSISDQTVKRHVSNLLRKAKAGTRTELAYRLGPRG